jgi:hypothetical protein
MDAPHAGRRRRHVVFLTRPGCGICDELLPRIRRVCRWLRRDVVVRDLTSDRSLEDEYHLRIPVVLDAHGRVLAEGTMNTRRLIRAIWRS